ncbi:exodeoxyribonuclease V subunit beta [Gayadomonas joobiniege]|uniref:exodeoxyribonuclease V subunit beta n=1 Tax=Gayadomonas joobiniege TaxID=1234606 RepID=UPI0003723AFB|nr:exodeoxyribonuclease V subunit beta [Gayadomonas joobiniege]
MNNKKEPIVGQKLAVETMQLAGRHLIEASAGTGKTFNITRIYLRLLLEKQLNVQQILVMTFTKAATEELKGRIERELRAALEKWGEQKDPFFQYLYQAVDAEQAQLLLKSALLELDDAAIFTIHGFCSRVLKQQAFASGLPLEMTMETDCSELLKEHIRDWFRKHIKQAQNYQLLKSVSAEEPDKFYTLFGKAIQAGETIHMLTAAEIEQDSQQAIAEITLQVNRIKANYWPQLQACETLIESVLIDKKKGDERKERQREWQVCQNWFTDENSTELPVEVIGFFDGRRHRNAELKEALAPWKSYLDSIVAEVKRIEKTTKEQIESVPCHQLLQVAISQIQQSFAAAKKQQAILDFDDLINTLHQILTRSESDIAGLNDTARQTDLINELKSQYPAALVDEFQDTDAKQYGILNALYANEVSSVNAIDKQNTEAAEFALFMIGDPKQAIYGFRGGDIHTYLKAREQADYIWFMDTNWRSDSFMVSAYNRLFYGAPLSQAAKPVFGSDIHYQAVHSTPNAKAAQYPLKDLNPRYKALNFVCWPTDNVPDVEGVREQAANWVCQQIKRLLNEVTLGERALSAGDIAILVRSGTEAAPMKQALQQHQLPSVYLSENSNVFESAQAKEMRSLLQGLLDLQAHKAVLAAMATPLLGYSVGQIKYFQSDAGMLAFEEAMAFMQELRQLWFKRGIMVLLIKLIKNLHRIDLGSRERSLTNYLHLAEILQNAARQHKHPQQLLFWFEQQITNVKTQSEAELRLETDANLIKIITQHKSKGLEYPIVFIPFADKANTSQKDGNLKKVAFEYYDHGLNKKVWRLGKSDQLIKQVEAETLAEAVRLMYVAITRAEYRCYICVHPTKTSHHSALGSILSVPDPADWLPSLTKLVDSQTTDMALLDPCEMNQNAQQHIQGCLSGEQKQVNLQHKTFAGKTDVDWMMYSFSSLSKNSASVHKQHERLDDTIYANDLEAERLMQENLPLRFRLKKGAATGDLLHDILEQVDFNQANWPEVCSGPLKRFVDLEEAEYAELYQWLDEIIKTPLPLPAPNAQSHNAQSKSVDKVCLADLKLSNTLREAEFYFPLLHTQVAGLTACLAKYRGQTLPTLLPDVKTLTGMMHGFIDLIFEHQGRFYVVDYKSTHLGNAFSDYQYEALKKNNEQHFYDLQYLIYSLALHRYLAARKADYSPEQDLGGVIYLYLRGMSAERELTDSLDVDHADPVVRSYGVFADKLDLSLLQELDDLMGKGVANV